MFRRAFLWCFCASLTIVGMVPAVRAQSLDIMLQVPVDPEAAKISVVVFPNLSHTRKLPTSALRQARKDMLADNPVSDDDLRALAEHHDGLAAQRLIPRLQTAGAPASDIAYYGSIAVSTGRIKSLRPAIQAMAQLDPATEPPERVQVYAGMLYAHAWAGNPIALDAVMDLNGEGRLFGPLSDKTRARIEEEGQKGGDGRVALRLAINLMGRGNAPAADLERARDYLAQAARSDQLAVTTTAANLLVTLDARLAADMASQ